MVRISGAASEMDILAKELPWEVGVLLSMVKHARMKIKSEYRVLAAMIGRHDMTGNRIVFAIVTASLIIGPALMVLSGIPPLWRGISVLGLAGFIATGLWASWR